MTEHELETRLRGWYRSHDADVPTLALGGRIAAIPDGVTLPSRRVGRGRYGLLLAAALLLGGVLVGGAIAVGAGPVRLPWGQRVVADPATIEPCARFARAIVRAGFTEGSIKSEHSRRAWGARVCVNDGYDGGWGDRHLLFQPEATSLGEARLLLAQVGPDLSQAGQVFSGWTEDPPATWIATWTADTTFYDAVAVFADPYFFVVTDRDVDAARSVADAILAELEDPVGTVP